MLNGGNDDGAFSLSSSGQLSLTQTLDREAQGAYILLITATDSGTSARVGGVRGRARWAGAPASNENTGGVLQCHVWGFGVKIRCLCLKSHHIHLVRLMADAL